MSILTASETQEEVHYPESDGKPIADNTLQFRYIVTIQGGIDYLFRHDPDVFVAGDLLWYPVEGEPAICAAPDTMVVFGRPKGDRRSYIQHQEGGIGPQVVFEVLSHNNDIPDVIRKYEFYNQYGVEEYYLYDPERGQLFGWRRENGKLQQIETMRGWRSPRLGVKFDLVGTDLRLINPDGTPFASYVELAQRSEEARGEARAAQAQAEQAQAQADTERERANEERARAERLAERLRAMGFDPET